MIEKAIYIEDAIYYDDHFDQYIETVNVYIDPEMNTKIDSISDLLENISKHSIDVNNYLDKASTITSYYHKAEDGSYYFVSSEITN